MLLSVVALEVFKIPKLELKATYKLEALKLNLFMHILNMRQKSVYIWKGPVNPDISLNTAVRDTCKFWL